MCATGLARRLSLSLANSLSLSLSLSFRHIIILLYTCPHTAIYVSAYSYIRPRTTICLRSSYSTVYVSATIYVSSCSRPQDAPPLSSCPANTIYVCPCMCPHAPELLFICPHALHHDTCPHALGLRMAPVSSDYYICVRMLYTSTCVLMLCADAL